MTLCRRLSLCLGLIALSGCASSLNQRDAFLASVPADTPYYLGVLEPIPEARWAKAGGTLDELIDTATGIFAQLPEAAWQEDSDDMRLVRTVSALANELRGNLNRVGMKRLGFDPDALAVLYGHGMWPTMRVGVGDEKALRASID